MPINISTVTIERFTDQAGQTEIFVHEPDTFSITNFPANGGFWSQLIAFNALGPYADENHHEFPKSFQSIYDQLNNQPPNTLWTTAQKRWDNGFKLGGWEPTDY